MNSICDYELELEKHRAGKKLLGHSEQSQHSDEGLTLREVFSLRTHGWIGGTAGSGMSALLTPGPALSLPHRTLLMLSLSSRNPRNTWSGSICRRKTRWQLVKVVKWLSLLSLKIRFSQIRYRSLTVTETRSWSQSAIHRTPGCARGDHIPNGCTDQLSSSLC